MMKAVRIAVEQGQCFVHRQMSGDDRPVFVLKLVTCNERGSMGEIALCRECAQVVANAGKAIAFIEGA
jgi:hypothetical protein